VVNAPFVSVVVASYNMVRELPRTLYSLSPAYQGIPADEYEVVLVDNGSAVPPTAAEFAHLGLDLTVLTTPDPSPSPAAAMNRGIAVSSGEVVCVYVDGARIASPGLLRTAREAMTISPRSIVASRGRYLGFAPQRESILEGYNQAVEDVLLDSTGWEHDGYRLFAVSVFDESSRELWMDGISESNSLFLRRTMLAELGGLDERFVSPGGGLANLDLWARACEVPDGVPVVLLGEATFHQIHGGAATTANTAMLDAMFDEYERLRGRPYSVPEVRLHHWGSFVAPHDPTELAHVPTDERQRAGTARMPVGLWGLCPAALSRHVRRAGGAALAVFTGRAARRSFLRQENADVALVEASGLFDASWYAVQYPEVVKAGFEPVRHFLRRGRAEGRQPGPGFDAVWYLRNNRDLHRVDINPLVHFLRHGRDEGRWSRCVDAVAMAGAAALDNDEADLVAASALFDAAWYLEQNPDAISSGLPPHVHYLRLGRAQRRNPGPHFDAVRYLADHPDVRASHTDPLVHYLRHGQSEGRIVHPVPTTPPVADQ
jgi:hypothetical protein